MTDAQMHRCRHHANHRGCVAGLSVFPPRRCLAAVRQLPHFLKPSSHTSYSFYLATPACCQPAARKEDIRFFRRLFALAVMMLIGQKIECEMSQVCSRFLRSDASLVSRHPPYAWLGTPYQEGCLSTTARCHIITVAFLSCPSVECRCILLTRRRLRHQVRV
jgi:hypothetical protein